MLFFLSVPHNPCWSVVVLCVKLVTYSPLKTMKSLMTNVKKKIFILLLSKNALIKSDNKDICNPG